MLGRAAEEEEEEEGRGRWVSLARSLFLASLSLPASCVAPPRGVRPLSLALALSFFGRHAEGKVRRRPPDPPRPPVCPSVRPPGSRAAKGVGLPWPIRLLGRPCARSWPSAACRLASGKALGEGPPDSLVLGGSPVYSSSLRGSELGVLPIPDSILSPGGGIYPAHFG